MRTLRRLLLLLLWLLALVLPGSGRASLRYGGVTVSPPLLTLCAELAENDDNCPPTLHLVGKHDRAGPPAPDGGTGGMTRPLTNWSYDGVGNVLKVTDPRNYVTTTAYDAANRKISVTAPAVPLPGHAGYVSPVTQMQYDGVGNVLQVTDSNGHTTVNTYDAVRLPRKPAQPHSSPAPRAPFPHNTAPPATTGPRRSLSCKPPANSPALYRSSRARRLAFHFPLSIDAQSLCDAGCDSPADVPPADLLLGS